MPDPLIKQMHDSLAAKVRADTHMSFDLTEYENFQRQNELLVEVFAEQIERLEDRIAILESWRTSQDDYSYEQRDRP